MKAGVTYNISYEDWRAIPGKAKQTVIEKNGAFGTAPLAKNGTNLAHNATTPPTGRRVGQTLEGIQEQDMFMLVKNTGGATSAGDVLVWANKNLYTVKREHAVGDSFAGVALGVIGAGNFGWIQLDGEATNVKITTGTAGALIAVDPTTAGAARIATGSDVPFGELLEDVTTGTADAEIRKHTGRDRYVRGRRFIRA